MNKKTDYKSRELLRQLINELATEYLKPDDCDKIYLKIEKIYCSSKSKQFRHYYSDIFVTITNIKVTMNEKDNKRDLAKLSANIELLHKNYDIKNRKKDITEYIKKLYDHISLELARLDYNDRVFKVNIEDSITEDVKKRIDDAIEKSYNDLDKKVKVVYTQFKDSERNYITILGIFASFVVTFVGMLSFTESVLKEMSKVSTYRLFVVILLLGFILLTICFSLYWFIARIVNKDDIKGLKSIYKVFVVVIVLLLAVCGVCWFFDNNIKELRNEWNIDKKNETNIVLDGKEEYVSVSTDSEIDVQIE